MRSLRDPRRPYLPAIRTPLERIYWGGAVVTGMILGVQFLSWPVDFFVLAAIGIGVTLIGWRVEGGISNHRLTGWLWVAFAAAIWLPIAFVRHSFPFSR